MFLLFFAGTYFYLRGAQDKALKHKLNKYRKEQQDVSLEDELHVAADGKPSSLASSYTSQKYLNSGCILGNIFVFTIVIECRFKLSITFHFEGRAGQMKRLLSYAKKYGRTYRDDQMAMVRYMFEHPGQVVIWCVCLLFLSSNP